MSKTGLRLRLALVLKLIVRVTEDWDRAFWNKLNDGRTTFLTRYYYEVLNEIWVFIEDLAEFVSGGRVNCWYVEYFVNRC